MSDAPTDTASDASAVALLDLNGVEVVDTFAEAFPIVCCRVIITAENERWAATAASVATGYATSVIACDCEAGVERTLDASETPDGRPGVALLFFAFDRDSLSQAVVGRIGQCVLTCPTTAAYDGLVDGQRDKRIAMGKQLRFFGDGYQISKKLGPRRLWRLPVMDGEFVCEDKVGTVKGVAGGNLLIEGATGSQALTAAEAAVDAIDTCDEVILPFPGGIVRSGSKVGSRYPALKASTNDAYCPTLRASSPSHLHPETAAVYELVVDGLSFQSVQAAMKAGLHAAAGCDGVVRITAGNYGGNLGPHHFFLKELLD